jgi:phage tail sheath protein FI
VVESHFVSVDPRKIDDEGKNIFCETVINAESNYIRIAIDSSLENDPVSAAYSYEYTTLAGGIDSLVNNNNPNGDPILDTNIIEAFELYQNPEDLDVNIFIDSDKSTNVKQNLISIAPSRLDAMALLDVPQSLVVNNKSNEATDMRDFRLGNHATYNLNENSSYAAVYGNWLNVYDKWNAKYRWIPSTGHAAGIFANTDDVSDAWFAPAGLNRSVLENVRKLAFNPSQSERDILYKAGINPIVSFAGQGKVLWGQKTLLDKSSAFNRINVRRLFMVLEKAISTVAKYFVFEPNDTYTRLLMVDMIDPFLRDIKARRGVYDYLVVCDTTNNTSERIDRGEMWVDMYIKPTRAAEFVVLQFIATKSGASFTELVAAETG